ncbi:MAG: GvpL/GvpF family gas vesicle protein [Methanoregula sp.]|nr:GvpL/GvpF family gas vesicle protein [Methanoregula sp.]
MSRTETRSKQRWRYAYAIIPSRKEHTFGQIGLDGGNVYTIHYREIAAVVSDSATKTFEVLDYGVTHQQALEKIMKEFCVIPMSFGQTATEGDIKMFLSRNYPKLKSYFAKLAGKTELGLKVTWKIDTTIKEIASSNVKIRAMKQQIAGKPLEKTYRQRLALGTKVAEELTKREEQIASEIFSRLGEISADSRMNKNLSDEMVLNAAFLVDKTKEREFDALVNTLEQEYGEKLLMKYVVAPPFNFVNVRIRS